MHGTGYCTLGLCLIYALQIAITAVSDALQNDCTASEYCDQKCNETFGALLMKTKVDCQDTAEVHAHV